MEYIKNVEVGKVIVEQPPLKTVSLFGREYEVYDDEWRNHLHIICTYKCQAKCEFCVEKNSKCDEKPREFLEVVEKTLCEMNKSGILHTVSITGGEPGMFKYLRELTEIIRKYPAFLTINTNGMALFQLGDGAVDFINISRHSVDDYENKEIFGTAAVPSKESIKYMKKTKFKDTKIRLQCLINENTKMDEFIGMVRDGYADDISIRHLMLDGSEESLASRRLYMDMVKEAVSWGTCTEQEVQDYYVYEVHKVDNVDITFSYSDMEALEQQERDEDHRFIREFIIRPDGTLSGSWFSPKIKEIPIK